jgi:hypothetical protein
LKTNIREQRLKEIRQVGQSIIDNAESILGTEEARTCLIIKAEFYPKEIPEIIIERHFIPEGVFREDQT